MGGWVGIIAACKIPVVWAHNGVLLSLFYILPKKLKLNKVYNFNMFHSFMAFANCLILHVNSYTILQIFLNFTKHNAEAKRQPTLIWNTQTAYTLGFYYLQFFAGKDAKIGK